MDAIPYSANMRDSLSVSIHAPVMDAIKYKPTLPSFICFNPRARDGRDTHTDSIANVLRVSIHAPVMDAIFDLPCHTTVIDVSIHAPVMDAICKAHSYHCQQTRFNPRAHDGRDTAMTLTKY